MQKKHTSLMSLPKGHMPNRRYPAWRSNKTFSISSETVHCAKHR